MNYQELRSLVGGINPQDATYEDIVSGIQSQYRPQIAGLFPTGTTANATTAVPSLNNVLSMIGR